MDQPPHVGGMVGGISVIGEGVDGSNGLAWPATNAIFFGANGM